MSPKCSALLVLMILEKAGSLVRPVVTFNPNWDKIFTTESLTMTCNVRSPIPPDMSYTWYKDNNPIHRGQSFAFQSAKQDNSGNYKCKGTNTDISDPIRLDVIHNWVILQAPLHVHEGDDVTLRCHHYPRYDGRQTIFYRDNSVMRDWGSDPELHIYNINLARSKGYKCTKKVPYSEYSGEASIPMKELFTTPEIKVTPLPVMEGDNVTLTCHTNVSPYRPETELQFNFYKDDQNVQRSSSSDHYGFQSAKLEDSGTYYCDAGTVSGRITAKKSEGLNIVINKLFSQPEIEMIPDVDIELNQTIVLTCRTSVMRKGIDLQFAFYKNGQRIQEFSSSHQYEAPLAKVEDSGNYYCEVRTLTTNVKKKSGNLTLKLQGEYNSAVIQNIIRLILSGLLLIISFLFIFYHIKFIKSLEPVNKGPRSSRL